MGKALETIASESGKGIVVGLAQTVLDPLGLMISSLDRAVVGAGYTGKRALPTFSNSIYQEVFLEPDKDVSFLKDQAPRYIGKAIGYGMGVVALGALALGSGLTAALALPALFGTYSTVRAGVRYLSNFADGEKDEGHREKASFMDGFRYGLDGGSTLGIMGLAHAFEGATTGRGIDTSHIKSSLREKAHGMRRNGRAIAGSIVGAVAGLGMAALTLGVLPLYKIARDTLRTLGNLEYTENLAKPRYRYEM